jgi:squalene-hopene/tetraprenyl-beta-curcumene cyclase
LLQLKTTNPGLAVRIEQAIARGRRFLEVHQQTDGSWLPLWFGNQYHTSEQNPVYGTAKVLTMCHELGWGKTEMARRGARFLADVQHGSGGWGPVSVKPSKTSKKLEVDATCSVEETALALEALLPLAKVDETFSDTLSLGLGWLIDAVEGGLYLEPAPIGFYFAKLWYHERLYPQIFATRTLQLACRASGAASFAVSAVC